MKTTYRWCDERQKVVPIYQERVDSDAPAGRVKDYSEIVGWSQPTLKMAKEQGLTRAPRYDKGGRPVFTNKRELMDYQARVNDNPRSRNQIEWSED